MKNPFQSLSQPFEGIRIATQFADETMKLRITKLQTAAGGECQQNIFAFFLSQQLNVRDQR